ncbi:DUF397 domain-containing protein [Streptomyces drozdowiczii]|uniref:DUF397 domain-containing protein n=1 Tax=Streptomyces drozdowiczii TaxID=202862 RepID=UPI0022486219|nr:DUF397 domain-containing protein [Streptomyces drozdowiczii]MCX0245472.1 DUF397 domain-containing protein [Streptomyces drozdowiczii]
MTHRPTAGEASELRWFKSSYSDSSNPNDCVEVAASPGAVHVRDSKDLSVPELAFGTDAWAGFVSYAADS